ncbi:MAG: response regulator [Candidatus Zixiibacteriota bacterium]
MTDASPKTILVVDDEEDVRQFLSIALVEAGFKVITAVNGADALDKVKQQKPDLISLDLVMPEHSGAKFYHNMTKNKEWAKIPIIIVTGHARDELGKADLKDLTMSGPGIYLEKPVKPTNYVAAIKKLLGMDTTAEETAVAEKVKLESEIKNLVDTADIETLKKIKAALKKKG